MDAHGKKQRPDADARDRCHRPLSPAVVLSTPSIATWISASKCVGASLVREISIPSIVAGPRSTTGVEPCAGASTSTPDQYCKYVISHAVRLARRKCGESRIGLELRIGVEKA